MKPFNDGEPLAYFLTWTTYGTWLPGDDRGWSHKGQGGPHTPNPLFVEMSRSRMTEPEFRLAVADRDIVDATIRRHCEIRNWSLHAINVRTNHVHVVVTASGNDPETVYEQFKAWCTRKLKSVHKQRENFWTERASRRWINREDDLQSAVTYVLEAQDGDRGAADWNP